MGKCRLTSGYQQVSIGWQSKKRTTGQGMWFPPLACLKRKFQGTAGRGNTAAAMAIVSPFSFSTMLPTLQTEIVRNLNWLDGLVLSYGVVQRGKAWVLLQQMCSGSGTPCLNNTFATRTVQGLCLAQARTIHEQGAEGWRHLCPHCNRAC